MNTQDKRRSLHIDAAAAVLLWTMQPAMAAPSLEAEQWMTQRLAQPDDSNETLSRNEIEKHLLTMFDQADFDGGGVMQSDYERAARVRNAQQRAARITAILRYDLNGDGKVTRAEVIEVETHPPLTQVGAPPAAPAPAQNSDASQQVVDRLMALDANRDGALVLSEMLSFANEQTQRTASRYKSELTLPKFLDEDGDGAVSRAEFKALFDHVFQAADGNNDDRLSPGEREILPDRLARLRQREAAASRAQLEAEQAKKKAAKCGIPQIPKTAKLVLLSAQEGQALSTASLGGDDEAATVARIVVERGRDELALVLTSTDAIVWQIEGNTERVSMVFVASRTGDAANTPRVGVVGIAREKVAFAKSAGCVWPVSSERRNVPTADADRFAIELGRKPDAIFATYDVPTIALPSGTIDTVSPFPGALSGPANGPATDIWNLMLEYNPKGLVDVDPAQIVAATKTARSAVRPQEAGLAQLVESGALEVTGTARIVQVGTSQVQLSDGDDRIRFAAGGPIEVRTIPKQYTIKSQINIPGGLHGGHAVTFVLPANVPEPKGDVGHSEILRIGGSR